MFRYEKDMIPIIRNFLLEKFNKGYFIQEFHSGIGVADLVFSPEIKKREYYFSNFEMLFHTLKLFNRKNKKLSEEDIKSKFLQKNIGNLIEKFVALNLIEEIRTNKYIVKNKLAPSVTEFYSIEAKISNWKSGFYQALRYKNFSHKSFLAISAEFIHRVDEELLTANNIGLISVSYDKTKIKINPKKNLPKDEIAFYYSGETFIREIYKEGEKEEFCARQWL